MEEEIKKSFNEINNNSVENFDENKKSNILLKIIISLIIVFIIIILVFLSYFLFFSGENKFLSVDDGKSLNLSLEETIKQCLSQDEFDIDCRISFSDEKILEICDKLGDDCFYKLAEVKFNSFFCEKIVNDELKNKCKKNFSFESFVENE
jgi:hypothetical protein